MTDDDENTITAEDIAWANRTMLVRAAGFTRTAGTVLVVVGIVGVAAALWAIVRTQQEMIPIEFLSAFPEFGDERDVSAADRADQFSRSYGVLVLPVIGVGLGLALRLMADAAVVRVGGSLSGFEVGHRLPPEVGDEDEDEPVDGPVLPPNPGDYEPGG
ncbi:MAG TPA: hypothetical protein VK611_28085 [Acidimicrobiales bacterium]|nr:hypothetical protein [Acidimicrobiales bacterium]